MTETENITSVTEASSGENLKIESVSLSGDFSEVCKNLEKNINSAVEADLKKAVEEHGKLENFERYLGSTCLVLLGLYNTEHKNVEDVLKKLVDMALTDMDKLSRKKLIALTTLAVFYNSINNSGEEVPKYELIDGKVFFGKHEYKFEFCDFSRLVVTPLTTRAYNYINDCMQAKKAGGFYGPAGTGKTETVKDFGKKLGRNVCVINCSDQLTAESIGKILDGLNDSNFVIFDEFNRIPLDVLEPVSEMFKKHAGKNIFITCNPGYAGRTELPEVMHDAILNCEETENDKKLKSGMAMLVPDFALIAEVMFYCKGLKSAKNLAKIITEAFSYFKENGSKQFHYDFGMRALKHFADCIGAVKRGAPEKCENQVFVNTWNLMVLNKFVPEDVELSNKYFADIFPGLKAEVEIPEIFKNEENAEKLTALDNLFKVRHSVAVVSKDKNNGLLKKYFDIKKADVETVDLGDSWEYPRDFADGVEMKNAYDPENGAVVKSFKKLTESKNDLSVLFFTGCKGGSPIVMEPLNSVMDDNKLLRLDNNEELFLKSNMKLAFDLESCSEMSPASVSRLGMLYL